ncbi:MAG TPA: ethanolamine ammonia-lyase reactivating factor EutA [Chthoniobacterales bacterium]
MEDAICLLGLDVGSTTTSLLLARVPRVRNCVTGRSEFGAPQFLAQPEAVFTPFNGERIDGAALERQLDEWLADPALPPIEAGGILLTGLAAQSANAAALRERLRRRLGDALVAAAPDPRLESWLAFHGGCGRLSAARPEEIFLNLDIGGGTTNLALGRAGEVRATASLWIGARHVGFDPGTRRVRAASAVGRRLLEGVSAKAGDVLREAQVKDIAEFCARRLRDFAAGRSIEDWLVDAPWNAPPDPPGQILLSGGVGELFYQCRAGADFPIPSPFGDLGADLARALADSLPASADIPPHRGRATVMGITLHSTEISGATIYVSPRVDLPLEEVPILGELAFAGDRPALPGEKSGVIGLRLAGAPPSAEALKSLAARLGRRLDETGSPVLVLLLESDLGKTLGSYLTDWGNAPRRVVVLDELSVPRSARFVRVGARRASGVPVIFYGLV